MIAPPGGRPLGFPVGERLRTDREFRDVVRKGERLHTAHYTLYRDLLGGGKRQVGISAGKRVGDSVERNRAKRLLREFYRTHKFLFPRGTRTAIVVRKPPGGAVLSSVCAELLPALRRRWGGNEVSTPCGPDNS